MQIHQGCQGYSAPAQDGRLELTGAQAIVVGTEGGGRQPASSEQVVALIEQVRYLLWRDGNVNLVLRSTFDLCMYKASSIQNTIHSLWYQ